MKSGKSPPLKQPPSPKAKPPAFSTSDMLTPDAQRLLRQDAKEAVALLDDLNAANPRK